MKKIEIKNKLGVVTHQATMEDPTEWIASQIAVGSWGRPERWVYVESLDFINEDASQVVEIVEEEHIDLDGNPYWKTKYKFPADYTIEITDITLEIEAEQAQIEEIKQAQLLAGQRLQLFPSQIDEAQSLDDLKSTIKQLVQDIAVLLR